MPVDLVNIDSISSNGTGKLSVLTGPSGSLAERMRIDSAGRVGIGTASPQHALDVIGGMRTTVGLYLGTTATPPNLSSTASGDLQIYVGTQRDIFIETQGNFAPPWPKWNASIFDINIGPKGLWSRLNLTSSTNFGNTVMSSISFCNWQIPGTPPDRRIAMIEAGTGTGGYDAGRLEFWTKTVGDPIAERMRITSSGNVGIGTQNPQYALDVAGTGNIAQIGNLLMRTGTQALVTVANPGLTASLQVGEDTDYNTWISRKEIYFDIGPNAQWSIVNDTSNDTFKIIPFDNAGAQVGYPFTIHRLTKMIELDGPVYTKNGVFRFANLPTADPGPGSQQLWYDPSDGNRVKYSL